MDTFCLPVSKMYYKKSNTPTDVTKCVYFQLKYATLDTGNVSVSRLDIRLIDTVDI